MAWSRHRFLFDALTVARASGTAAPLFPERHDQALPPLSDGKQTGHCGHTFKPRQVPEARTLSTVLGAAWRNSAGSGSSLYFERFGRWTSPIGCRPSFTFLSNPGWRCHFGRQPCRRYHDYKLYRP